MTPTTRYQAAVIRDHQILLIKQLELATGRTYWLLPGGRREPDETEEACVQREVVEETGLHVLVQSLLFEEPGGLGASYQRCKTYHCHWLAGEAHPGHEPEAEYATAYRFTEVGWFDLRTPLTWQKQIRSDPLTYPLLQRIQAALGYPIAGRTSRA